MHTTHMIIDRIRDELEETSEYLESVVEVKGSNPEMAKLFLGIAKEELNHAERLIEFKAKQVSRMKMDDESHKIKKTVWEVTLPFLNKKISELKREIDIEEHSVY